MTGAECGHVACENCGAVGDDFGVEPTGQVRKRLLDWMKHRGGPQGRNGPIHSVKEHGVEEAEVEATCCHNRFWTLAPAAIAAARELPAYRYQVVA